MELAGKSKFIPQSKEYLFQVEGPKLKAISFLGNDFHRGQFYDYTVDMSDRLQTVSVPHASTREDLSINYCAV